MTLELKPLGFFASTITVSFTVVSLQWLQSKPALDMVLEAHLLRTNPAGSGGDGDSLFGGGNGKGALAFMRPATSSPSNTPSIAPHTPRTPHTPVSGRVSGLGSPRNSPSRRPPSVPSVVIGDNEDKEEMLRGCFNTYDTDCEGYVYYNCSTS